MVGAHQNLNGSRDLTTPLSQGWFATRGLALATVNLPTEFEVSISTNYEDMKSDTKCQYGVVYGIVRVTQGHQLIQYIRVPISLLQ